MVERNTVNILINVQFILRARYKNLNNFIIQFNNTNFYANIKYKLYITKTFYYYTLFLAIIYCCFFLVINN
jgi:hypothetical protein